MKKLFLLCALLIAVLPLSGCTTRAEEKFVEDFYKKVIDKEITPEEIYDNYISQTSKDVLGITKEEYVADYNEANTNLEITDVSILSSNAYDKAVAVKREVEATVNGEETTEINFDYVIEENGEMKFLQYGSYEKVSVDGTFGTGELSITTDEFFIGVNNVVVHMIIDNASSKTFSLGHNLDGVLVVETTEGSYTADITQVPVRPGVSSSGIKVVDNVKGEVLKISLQNVYETDTQSQPLNPSSPLTYVLYSKE